MKKLFIDVLEESFFCLYDMEKFIVLQMVEGMRTELPTGGGLVAVCHYLHKEGSQSGQGKPQSQASLGNSRQGAGAGGRRDPEASASHHR